jgi:hypothetical protein
MQRRTFVKALLFTLPALYIKPFSCLSDTMMKEIMEQPGQEFVIYFIGNYGKQVFEQFRSLRRQYPIQKKCEHVTMDVNSEEGFILVSDNHDPVDLLVKSMNCDLACFVMDTRRAESVALSEGICKVLKLTTEPYFLCLSPVMGNITKKEMFNLSVATYSTRGDLSADFLLTLYNTYLGCGGIGEFQCLKYLFEIADLKYSRYSAIVGIDTQQGNLQKIDIPKLVTNALHYLDHPFSKRPLSSIYGVLEINSSERDVLSFFHAVQMYLSRTMDQKESILIVHPGLQQKEVKLTLLNIIENENTTPG